MPRSLCDRYARWRRAISNSYACSRIFQLAGAPAPAGLKDRTMTLFHSYPGDLPAGGRHLHVARALGRLGTAFKAIHDAIVAAKLRRLQSELMFHECWPAQTDTDAAKFPRRPMILGDKWDF